MSSSAITDFVRGLENARGQGPFAITVVPWIDSPPLEERPARQLRIPPFLSKKRPNPERDLGFRLSWRRLRIAGTCRCVMTIEDIQPSGIFDRAGFHNKDIVLHEFQKDFLRLVKMVYRGEEVVLSVLPWIDPPRLQDRPTRTLTVRVPS